MNMKGFVTVVTSLVLGLFLVNSGFAPLRELHELMQHKRRFLASIILSATAFVFLLTGIITASIETALQYDQQGVIFWSALFSMATVFVCAATFFAALAAVTLPRVQVQTSLFSEIGQLPWTQFIEMFMEQMTSEPSQAQAKQPESTRAAADERPADSVESVPYRDLGPKAELHH